MSGNRMNRGIMMIVALVGLGACGDNDVTNVVPSTGPTLTIVSNSNGQSGTVGTALASPLSVRAADANGNPMVGVTVGWAVTSGSIPSATSTTDSNGIATMTWTLGNTAGVNSAISYLTNGPSVTFTATGTAAAGGT